MKGSVFADYFNVVTPLRLKDLLFKIRPFFPLCTNLAENK